MASSKDEKYLQAFSEDLFRYLFFKRISLKVYSPSLREGHQDINLPSETLNIIGQTILCIAYLNQKRYFKYFFQNICEFVENEKYRLDKVSLFCMKGDKILNSKVVNKNQKILNCGSIFLEMAVFSSLLGFKHIKYFMPLFYSKCLYTYLRLNTFNIDDLSELYQFALKQLTLYREEYPDIFELQNDVPDIKTQKLREYDLWASDISSRKSVSNVEPLRSAFSENRIHPVKFLQHDIIIIELLRHVKSTVHPTILQRFSKVYEEKYTTQLLKNEFIIQVISDLCEKVLLTGVSRIEMSPIDLFQMSIFVIDDQETLGKFIYLVIQLIYKLRHENYEKLLTPILGIKYKLNDYGLGRVKKEFLRFIERKKDVASKEISVYFRNNPSSKIFKNEVFIMLLKLISQHPTELWDHVWILSIMKAIDTTITSSFILPGLLKNKSNDTIQHISEEKKRENLKAKTRRASTIIKKGEKKVTEKFETDSIQNSNLIAANAELVKKEEFNEKKEEMIPTKSDENKKKYFDLNEERKESVMLMDSVHVYEEIQAIPFSTNSNKSVKINNESIKNSEAEMERFDVTSEDHRELNENLSSLKLNTQTSVLIKEEDIAVPVCSSTNVQLKENKAYEKPEVKSVEVASDEIGALNEILHSLNLNIEASILIKEIKEHDPDLLDSLKMKSLLDKQIKKKLLKFHNQLGN